MTTRIWADCSNTNGHAADGAALRAIGCTALAAKATQGTTFTDELLGANYAQAKAAGLDFIAYHFLDTSDGAAQAEFFTRAVQAACGTLELGLMADWEKLGNAFPSPATVDSFLERLAQLAPKAAISVYTAAWVIEGAGGPSAVATRYPLVWLSYVPPNPPDDPVDPRQILSAVTPGYFRALRWLDRVRRLPVHRQRSRRRVLPRGLQRVLRRRRLRSPLPRKGRARTAPRPSCPAHRRPADLPRRPLTCTPGPASRGACERRRYMGPFD